MSNNYDQFFYNGILKKDMGKLLGEQLVERAYLYDIIDEK